MKNLMIGRGWGFPPKINQQGGLALTDEETDIQQAIRIILSTAPGERIMRPTFRQPRDAAPGPTLCRAIAEDVGAAH